MEFIQFKEAIQNNFMKITKDSTHLFFVNVDKKEFWELYLSSFPDGANEIFRERTEHDCCCCHHFINSIGNVVVLKNNKVHTLWELDLGDTTYQPVSDALDQYIKNHIVSDIYVSKEEKIGTNFNFEEIEGKAHKWEHFYIELPSRFVDRTGRSVGDIQGCHRDTKNVFKRSLDEISENSILTVLELINSNTLYKGEEWKGVLTDFHKLKVEYDRLNSETEKNLYTWEQSVMVGINIGRIKNHSMGTLLINISEDMDLDLAVKKYEQIVAPNNYKRPKAIFTKKMLESAKNTLSELGYMESLGRRYAKLDDITINNILFSNRDASKKIIGSVDIFDRMEQSIPVNPKKFSKIEAVSIDKFITDILPTAKELELYLENKHSSNMVSLIAPEKSNSKTMFKWNNNFSWAYSGNVTDSDITQRVKLHGGRLDGVLRFSHSWNYENMRNGSLMDLHVFMPGSSQPCEYINGKEIHDNYGNKERVGWNWRNHTPSGGTQDVDYVDIAPAGYIPVENITFPSLENLADGIYTFKIHNWNLRQPTQGGFKAEISFNGQIYNFTRAKPLENKEWITLAKIELNNGRFNIVEMMENETTQIEIWNLKINQFIPISTMMFSPNYWDEQNGIGHKHYFFMLKECANSEQPNGFYNEFLKNELVEHKRVFEALGSQMKVSNTEIQLSGVGFSSTKRDEVIVKVKGLTERTIKLRF